ncbi:MAG: quinohemoprotein amine dehydrogenase maturation protein [Gammaproteobacteria bacterium]|nr:quinohemoprotein amine dehydrogenase maturation protein [Gammaproteobacteria bacterium]
MQALNYISTHSHDVRVNDRRVLFHIPTTALFDLDDVGGAVLDLFKQKQAVTRQEIQQRFDGVYPPQDVIDTIDEFLDLQIISDGRPLARDRSDIKITEYPLSTIVLNVNTGCNLGCTYCYKEDLETPANGQKMDFKTAQQGIELLLREGEKRDRINVVFFGGEPLSNLPLIKQVADYAEHRCAEQKKTVDFSITTNATLLKEKTIDWLNDHRFSIAISMDGPQAIHDKHRLTVGGRGTYAVVAEKSRLLLERYTARPVGARVTLTRGNTNVIAIHDHLINDIGFFEVGFAPVTSNENAQFNLRGDELNEVFAQMKQLGAEYERKALCGENNGFSNMHQLMTDLHEGTRKTLPCGAGVGMLAVDKNGDLNLCHRFTGSTLPTYGNVIDGIDKPRLGEFLENAADRSDRGCATCRIRNLCAGGCYHESYAHFNDPLMPTYHYCDIMRDWVDFGIGVYANITTRNPAFFSRHVTPRRAVQ